MSRFALAASLLLGACSREGRVTAGSTVSLDYELSSGGVIVESSPRDEPLVVTQGAGDLPPSVDAALLGLKPGDQRDLALTSDQGFGTIDPGKVKTIPLAKFGAMAKDLKPGRVVAGAEGGRAAEGRVVKIEKGSVTLDFNHPLAGKALRYKLKVIAVRVR